MSPRKWEVNPNADGNGPVPVTPVYKAHVQNGVSGCYMNTVFEHVT